MKIKIYRKPTQTDQYLHFRSKHKLIYLSVVRTMLHRSEIVTDPEDISEEVEQVKKGHRNCGYRDWAFFRASNKREKTTLGRRNRCLKKKDLRWRCHTSNGPLNSCVEPSIQQAYLQPSNPIKRYDKPYVSPKDKFEKSKQSGTVYEPSCLPCESVFIRGSGRKLEKRLSEHKLRALPSISEKRT